MTALRLRFTGSIAALSPEDRVALLDRSAADDESIQFTVSSIIEIVRRDGDAALTALARELDGVTLSSLEVPRAHCVQALEALDPSVRAALERAHRNLSTVHRASIPRDVAVETESGVHVGLRAEAFHRVGIYAPGGRAAYPSSVLMGAVPARIAGVREVVLCTPPGARGRPSPVTLAAAMLAGVDRVFAVGGAGAIAAMAYGTATIPRVDHIVGPGNAYVAEAKLQVARVVSTDAPAGPSELLVIADDTADPTGIAREMLAQAEHDPNARVLALLIGRGREAALGRALSDRVDRYGRRTVIRRALADHGGILTADDLDEALVFAGDYAAEHVWLSVGEPQALLPRLRNAGAVFLGPESSVTFGDYLAGGNHVLPTGGLARSYGALTTHDFVRWMSWQHVEPAAARRLAADVARLAEAEGLDGHALAARAWDEAQETPE
ncbi:MAG TPA: histidinol dehydrogenase [Gemmatimonadaceae bacterium]|nr:histidinol dehydrogenase [Gemmatimonadaceae bacterium]